MPRPRNAPRHRRNPAAPRRFRELLARPGIIRSLGAHDGFSALIMEQAGFHMVFLDGFGASASPLGLPDLNFLTMSQFQNPKAIEICLNVSGPF